LRRCFALAVLGSTTIACLPSPSTPGRVMDSAVHADARGLATPLVCPGARGCENGDGDTLRVGAAARVITPDFDDGPVYLAGFDIGRQATGVHDDIEVRAIVLERGDVRIGVVVADTVGLFHPEVMTLRNEAAARGLALDDIALIATHNHETKDTMGLWGPTAGESGYDVAYMAHVQAQAADALAEATAELEATRMVVATADAVDLVNDTREPYVLDGTVYGLEFIRADGSAVADVIVWGNHPETLGGDNTLVTSDYPHYVRSEVEARRPGTTALFLPGLLGGLTTSIGLNVCPDENGVDTCPQGTFTRAEKTGVAVAERIVAAFDAAIAAGRVQEAPALSSRRLPVMLTPRTLTLSLAFQVGLVSRPLFDATTGEPIDPADVPFLSINDFLDGTLQIDSEVAAIGIGEVELTLVPGELYSELWLEKSDGSPFIERPEGADFPDAAAEVPLLSVTRPATTRIVVNQANDATGYLIPLTQWDTESPRAYGGQYGEQNSLGPTAAGEVVSGVHRLYDLDLE
jgi:hypothetical protein